jgi:hypothetical protein
VRAVTDAQVRKLMEEMSKHGRIGDAAMKAGMHRETARKYVDAGELPSALVAPRDWRTRPDPFEEHCPAIEARLRATPELEAKTLFELLQKEHPDRYDAGQLRTLQRRVKRWLAEHSPERDIVLAQQHRPGEAALLRGWQAPVQRWVPRGDAPLRDDPTHDRGRREGAERRRRGRPRGAQAETRAGAARAHTKHRSCLYSCVEAVFLDRQEGRESFRVVTPRSSSREATNTIPST